MSKYKEKTKQLEIITVVFNENTIEIFQSASIYRSYEIQSSEQNSYELNNIKGTNIYFWSLGKNWSKKHVGQFFEININKNSEQQLKELEDKLYTEDDITELQAQYQAEKLNLYTKEQVEELLEKQRELCADKAELKGTLNNVIYIRDSILNAKLKIK